MNPVPSKLLFYQVFLTPNYHSRTKLMELNLNGLKLNYSLLTNWWKKRTGHFVELSLDFEVWNHAHRPSYQEKRFNLHKNSLRKMIAISLNHVTWYDVGDNAILATLWCWQYLRSVTNISNLSPTKTVTNIYEEIGIPIIESKRYDEIYLYSELWFHLMIKHWILFYRFDSS